MNKPGEDRPIEHADADKFGRSPFVDNLTRALVDDVVDSSGLVIGRRASGLTIGLTGRWGLGKSSVVNLLAEKLKRTDHVAVTVFNPWLFKGRDELLAAFFNQLRDAMGRSGVEHARDLVGALDKYRLAIDTTARAVTLAADAHGGLGLFTLVGNKVRSSLKQIKPFKDRSPSDERRSLESKLTKSKIAVVVLIDELDRVEDDDVRSVAQLIKAAGDIKGISYLVAYDPRRVADALGRGAGEERQQTGLAYLEKIIQHPIPLRPMFDNDVDALLDSLLQDSGINLDLGSSDPHQQAIIHQIRSELRTPRELKRLVGVFASIERMVRGEIRVADVLGYSWIVSKAPYLREVIANDFDRLVIDPTHAESMRRYLSDPKRGQADLVADLGEEAGHHATLLKLLFPHFETGFRQSSIDRIDNGDRVFLRRNLVRLLYLGDPPGTASFLQLQNLYGIADQTYLLAEITELTKSGALPGLIDLLGDSFTRLPKSGDGPFWLALAQSLVRESWLLEPDNNAAIADDAVSYLIRLGKNAPADTLRVKEILSLLERAGDLVLLPEFLRRHLFAHGLTKERESSSQTFVLSRDETSSLLARQLPRYINALRDGYILKHIPNADALFTIKNVGAWDSQLRTDFTGQLRSHSALRAFAGMVVPPGYSIDRKTLDTLFDADIVQTWMNEQYEPSEAGDAWIDNCLGRLRTILENRNVSTEA